MSAKPAKKGSRKSASAMAGSIPAAAAADADVAAGADAGPAWIDSTDPRRRRIGRIVLAAIWVYVAALWLLALDQTFHWGVFGPKIVAAP